MHANLMFCLYWKFHSHCDWSLSILYQRQIIRAENWWSLSLTSKMYCDDIVSSLCTSTILDEPTVDASPYQMKYVTSWFNFVGNLLVGSCQSTLILSLSSTNGGNWELFCALWRYWRNRVLMIRNACLIVWCNFLVWSCQLNAKRIKKL